MLPPLFIETLNKTQFPLAVCVCSFWSICYKPKDERKQYQQLFWLQDSWLFFNSENLKGWKWLGIRLNG